ncbi:hypothetical protein DFS34DRAFT_58165 [Phlyctochytrium arcticum]|nr:hypothetical protein DFS34DRAFT_58165 [Phlyctochytrium arcticum]
MSNRPPSNLGQQPSRPRALVTYKKPRLRPGINQGSERSGESPHTKPLARRRGDLQHTSSQNENDVPHAPPAGIRKHRRRPEEIIHPKREGQKSQKPQSILQPVVNARNTIIPIGEESLLDTVRQHKSKLLQANAAVSTSTHKIRTQHAKQELHPTARQELRPISQTARVRQTTDVDIIIPRRKSLSNSTERTPLISPPAPFSPLDALSEYSSRRAAMKDLLASPSPKPRLRLFSSSLDLEEADGAPSLPPPTSQSSLHIIAPRRHSANRILFPNQKSPGDPNDRELEDSPTIRNIFENLLPQVRKSWSEDQTDSASKNTVGHALIRKPSAAALLPPNEENDDTGDESIQVDTSMSFSEADIPQAVPSTKEDTLFDQYIDYSGCEPRRPFGTEVATVSTHPLANDNPVPSSPDPLTTTYGEFTRMGHQDSQWEWMEVRMHMRHNDSPLPRTNENDELVHSSNSETY